MTNFNKNNDIINILEAYQEPDTTIIKYDNTKDLTYTSAWNDIPKNTARDLLVRILDESTVMGDWTIISDTLMEEIRKEVQNNRNFL